MDAWDYIFHPVNPVINLGVAQNDLMNDELSEKVGYAWVCVMILAINHYALHTLKQQIPASIGFELSVILVVVMLKQCHNTQHGRI